MADSKKYNPRIPIDYQELAYISNSGTQYIGTGLKGSDLADCEVEIVIRNNTTTTTAYNFNGAYLSGSTAQFGLVATSSNECRSSMNFGFADAISTTGLNLSEFHTIYATNGLQKVDNTVVGTLNFGTLNDGNFLLFARTDPNVTSGVSICAAMSLKSFTVKRNNQYIRNMIPVRRISDSVLGLYDAANDVFYTNQGTGTFTAGSEVNNWQHSLRKLGTSTDTITTLPVDLYADGNNATGGLVGNMSQSGTPAPENPITPQETGERTENLFASVWEQGAIDGANGQNATSSTTIRTKDYVPVSYNSTYSMQRSITGGYINLRLYAQDKTYIGTGSSDKIQIITGTSAGNPMSQTQDFCCFKVIDSSVAYVRMNDLTNNLSTQYMMVEGEYTEQTMPSYQPYGYKIPISSANTTTPVYLGEVESTRQIKKLVLDGTEDWTLQSINSYGVANYSLSNSGRDTSTRVISCTHYEQQNTSINNTRTSGIYNGSNIFIRDTSITTADDFKTFLVQQYTNGTPVTIWCVLAEPETAVVNEPLRKIGDYADTVSGVTIPTIAGADSFDVQTTLKPSEVSLAYTGWHDAEVKEWDGSEWQ